MKAIKHIVLLAVLQLFFAKSEASHLMGGELTYQWVSGNTYSLVFSLYRDCSGISLIGTENILVSSANAGYVTTVTLTLTATSYTREVCPASASTTACNGGFNFGYEKRVYIGNVTLPSAQSDWKFSTNSCCRNGSITNLSNASSYGFYLESTLNNLISANNSAQFSTQPVIIIQTNQTQAISWNAYDAEGDMLEYRLVNPLDDQINSIPFLSGYSATQPFNSSPSAQFDTSTGALIITPIGQQVVVASMIVTERRQGVVVGTIRRDLQMVVINASISNPPVLTGFNGTNSFEMDINADSLAILTIQSYDADSGQQLGISWDPALPQMGAIFTPLPSGLHPGLQITWTPDVNALQRSRISFTITVRDDNCPYNSVQVFTYTLNILPSTQLRIDAGNNIVICSSDTGRLNANILGGIPPFSHQWLPAQGLDSSGILNPSVAPDSTTLYYLMVTDSSGVTIVDSVLVTVSSPLNIDSIQATNVSCFGASDGDACIYVSGGTPAYAYLWSDSSVTSCIASLPAALYSVTTTDANGCSASTSFGITEPQQLIVDSIIATDVFCYGGNDGEACLYLFGGALPYNYLWSETSTTACINAVSASVYSVSASDANGCSISASATIAEPAPFTAQVISSGGGNNPDTLSVQQTGGISPFSYQWYFNNAPINGATADIHIANFTGNYNVSVTDSNGCQAVSPVIFVQLNCSAHYTLYPDTTTPHHWFALNQSSGSAPISYIWYWGDGDTSTGASPSHVYAATGNYNICVSITDGALCMADYCDSSTYVYKTEADIISVNVVSELPSGIAVQQPAAAINIYPNPLSEGNWHLVTTNEMFGKDAKIYSVEGNLLHSQRITTSKTEMDASRFSKGVYLIRIGNAASRIIKL
jgi:hypothetical protein